MKFFVCDKNCIQKTRSTSPTMHLMTLTIALFIIHLSSSAAHNGNSLSNDNNAQSSKATTSGTINMTNIQQDTEVEHKTPLLNDSKILFEPLIRFSGALFNQIRSENDNIILSPLSVHAALNLVQLGAEPGTETDTEIRQALAYPKDTKASDLIGFYKAYKNAIELFQAVSLTAIKQQDDPAAGGSRKRLPVVDFYNTIITKQSNPLVDSYSKQTRDYYNSTVEPISMEKPETISKVIDKVNRWAKDAGFEEKILDASEFKGDFTTMLLSAVRVQAYWFKAMHELRHKTVFYNHGFKDKPVQVKQLGDSDLQAKLVEFSSESKVEFKIPHAQVKDLPEMKDLVDLNARALEIPLQGRVSFVLVEPKDNGTGGELTSLVQKLFKPSKDNNENNDRLSKLLKVLDGTEEVRLSHLSMPKFTFENNIDLKGPLKKLGISRAFERPKSELKRVVQGETVYIDAAKHQAMIDVNKDGIKAAGVTKIAMMRLSAMMYSNPINIKIENPFLFIIRYERIPLFIGQLVELKE